MNITESMTSSLLQDFDDIKDQYRIDDDRFKRGIHFALRISEGASRVKAYMEAFNEEDKREASNQASKFLRLKWVSSLVDRLVAGNHILFADKHYEALMELYNIGMNGESERNRVDALKSFVDSTKRPEAKIDTQVNISIGANMIHNLEAQLNKLVDMNSMIDTDGNIIDVKPQ